MKRQLNNILNNIDNEEGNRLELAYEALSITKDILNDNPFDISIRITRMRLNADIFENTTDIIEDATFIIENDEFKEHKMIGYDWLFWMYNDILSLPTKAQDIIEEQLVEMQSLFPIQHEKDEKEGGLLNKLAQLKFDNNEKKAAVKIWEKSFDKYPFLNNRNGFVGLYLLENKEFEKAKKFLFVHYDWCYNTEDGYRLKYGIKLKELFDAKELENEGDLVGLLFNVIRNEKEHFNIVGKLDFFEKYNSTLEELANKFPDSTLLWTVISNMYLADTKNYQKSFEAFQKLSETKDHFRFTSMEKAIKAAKKSDNNFFDLTFSFDHSANDLYSCLTDFSEAVDNTKSKKKKKKFSELAVAYGKMGYERFREYLIDGKGFTENNHPHIFAMLCNNYANALGEYAELHHEEDDDEKEKLYRQAGSIHVEGHNMSPFRENMVNAAHDYFSGKDYENARKFTIASITEYKEDLSAYDFQSHYFRIVRSSIGLEDVETAEEYYLISKAVYNKVGKDSKNATYNFIFSGKVFLEYMVTKKNEYKKYIPEMEWFLSDEVALKQEPKEHGLVSYYLGLCYKETNQKEKAIEAFQTTVDYLQDVDWEFYDLKCEHAEELIEELGGKVVKKINPNENNKSAFRRTIDAFLFPFMILALIGGLIWTAAMGSSSKEENNEGKNKK